MKTVAAETLTQIFQTATVLTERQIGTTGRVADVVAILEESLKPWGKGLVVEAQHKHEEKNIGRVSRQYLSAGYSVYWLYQSDLDGVDIEFAEHRLRTVWPDVLPDREGMEGYPECVRKLRGFGEEPSIEVRLPRAYRQAHALEVVSPSTGLSLRTGWREYDRLSLKADSDYRIDVGILLSPADTVFLELHKATAGGGREWQLPMLVTGEDLPAFETFLDQLPADRRAARQANGATADEPRAVATVTFTGIAGVTPGLALVEHPDGPPELRGMRVDQGGNASRLWTTYRPSVVEPLREARHLLDRVL